MGSAATGHLCGGLGFVTSRDLGRLEPVHGTEFVGIWGAATLEAYRGRGIYRALNAARARSAMARGKTLVHSDSSEFSRPILERSGLLKVSTTIPYYWRK